MGFMDKVKSAAQDVATEAKKATAQGQEKLGEMQTRKKMDESAKQLGYLIFRERTEGASTGGDADRLVSEMKELEAQLQAAATSPTPGTSASTGSTSAPPAGPAQPQPTSSEPASGDFKL